MPAVAEVLSLIVSLLQVVSRATEQVTAMTALIEKAKSEGRDLTDAEVEDCRKMAVIAIARLA